ncbi:MAG: carbon storage regulator CsrA [Patescibacteria group bacterium]
MLVLSRKRGERVMIGDIEVTILKIQGNRVRLGISAPREIPVHRQEVYLSTQAAKDNAKPPATNT